MHDLGLPANPIQYIKVVVFFVCVGEVGTGNGKKDKKDR